MFPIGSGYGSTRTIRCLWSTTGRGERDLHDRAVVAVRRRARIAVGDRRDDRRRRSSAQSHSDVGCSGRRHRRRQQPARRWLGDRHARRQRHRHHGGADPGVSQCRRESAADHSGPPAIGGWRSDIAAVYGSQFGASGFTGNVTMPGPGVYRLRASGYDPLGDAWYVSNPRRHHRAADAAHVVDTPVNRTVASDFMLGGWAIDAGSGLVRRRRDQRVGLSEPGSGRGGLLRRHARLPARGPTSERRRQPVHAERLRPVRPSVGGDHQLVVYAHSTVTASWSQAQSVYVTVSSGVMASVDIPSENETVAQPFTIAGWAVDASWRRATACRSFTSTRIRRTATRRSGSARRATAAAVLDIGASAAGRSIHAFGWASASADCRPADMLVVSVSAATGFASRWCAGWWCSDGASMMRGVMVALAIGTVVAQAQQGRQGGPPPWDISRSGRWRGSSSRSRHIPSCARAGSRCGWTPTARARGWLVGLADPDRDEVLGMSRPRAAQLVIDATFDAQER